MSETTKYIKNEFGGVHSVDNAEQQPDGSTAYTRLLTSTPGGQRLLPAGWSEITAAEAKKANPQLFGAADPLVRASADEIRKDYERRKAVAEFEAEYGDPTVIKE